MRKFICLTAVSVFIALALSLSACAGEKGFAIGYTGESLVNISVDGTTYPEVFAPSGAVQIGSADELADFEERCRQYGLIGKWGSAVFENSLSLYDDEFFENGELLILGFANPYSCYRDEVADISSEGDTVTVRINKYLPSAGVACSAIIGENICIVELPKGFADGKEIEMEVKEIED